MQMANVRAALYVKFHDELTDWVSLQTSPMKRPVTLPPELVLMVPSSLVGI